MTSILPSLQTNAAPGDALRLLRLALGVGAALASIPQASVAQGIPAAYGGLSGADASSQATVGRRVDLSIGRSLVIDLPRDAKEVFVANPAVANAIVRSTRKVFLIGIANGATSVFVMDGDGRQIASLEVNVGRDLSVLRQTLRAALPNAQIDIKPAGNSILMTGSVASAGDAQQAADIAAAFVGQSSGGAGAGAAAGGGGPGASFSGGVINVLTIRGRDQVMLKVVVAEVSRNVIKQFGVNLGGNWNVVETAATAAATAVAKTNPASNLVGFASGAIGSLSGTSGASVSGQFGNPNYNVGGTLTALERAGVSRVLAEPNLTAISGEAAKFVVGGEVPVPSSCPAATVGCPTTFKQYGVLLNFTPVVLAEGRISIRIGTEVSEIDETVAVGGVPGFRLRRTETTVELPSGGTLMTAGLIQQTGRQTINGLPGLLNLPVLGTLFRSRDYQRQDTELVIMVTPYIVKPIEATKAVRPTDGFVDARDTQGILLGRLNKIYGVAGASAGAKPRGDFGFITE